MGSTPGPGPIDMQHLYRKLDVENFDSIQEKLVPWIMHRYDGTLEFWHFVDQQELFSDIPELNHTIEKVIGQKPKQTFMIAISGIAGSQNFDNIGAGSLHRDTSLMPVRFNWPVLNSTSIETRLFKSLVEPAELMLPNGTTYLQFHEHDCEQIDSFFLDRPTIFHVHTIHGLYPAPGPLPRYILSFEFDQCIKHLL